MGEENASAEGISDAGDELDGCLDDIQDQEVDEERIERGAKEGQALLWARGRRRVYTLAKVPAKAAHGEHELEGILQPQREESRTLTFPGGRIPRGIRTFFGCDGRD